MKAVSLDENFDLVLFQQDRASFRRWAESMRNESTAPAMRETDAVICEVAQYSLQRSLSRVLPAGFTWSASIEADGVRINVRTGDGRDMSFRDGNLGVLIYRLEREDFRPIEAPPVAPTVAPFRFADVDASDPFERARAEILLRRAQASAA
jgi:hypothetical protein